jgi:acetolactate synthase-1/2/3 large subunit
MNTSGVHKKTAFCLDTAHIAHKNSLELLSGGEMLIRALADEGVEFLFGYPGGAVLHIYDAIFQQERVKHILVRHEQAAGHMADGYSRRQAKQAWS